LPNFLPKLPTERVRAEPSTTRLRQRTLFACLACPGLAKHPDVCARCYPRGGDAGNGDEPQRQDPSNDPQVLLRPERERRQPIREEGLRSEDQRRQAGVEERPRTHPAGGDVQPTYLIDRGWVKTVGGRGSAPGEVDGDRDRRDPEPRRVDPGQNPRRSEPGSSCSFGEARGTVPAIVDVNGPAPPPHPRLTLNRCQRTERSLGMYARTTSRPDAPLARGSRNALRVGSSEIC
jgi:hypothetical protein